MNGEKPVAYAEEHLGHKVNPSRLSTIAIPTFNRVQGLRRALNTYIENTRHYGREVDFLVMDGASNAGVRKDCKEMLASLKKQHKVSISYGGLEEKLLFAKKLIDTKELPPEVVKFSLFDTEKCGQDYGVSRNALFMHTVGDLFMSVDDDTVCSVAPSPEITEGMAFGRAVDPGEIRVFADRLAAQEAVNVGQHDFLAIHESALGEKVSDLARRFMRSRTSLEDGEWQAVKESNDARVLITYNGWTGDCAWGSPIPYLILTGSSFQHLTRSEAEYRAACTSREILRYVSRITLTDATAFMMTIFAGFDNRVLLPPFLPIKRGEDTVFGVTFSICFEHGFAAHLPGVLHHSPVENRMFWPGEVFRSSSGIDLSTLILACIKTVEFSPAETKEEDRLKRLGKQLEQMASASISDFEEAAHGNVLRELSAFKAKLQARLESLEEAPEYWADDVRRYIDTLQVSLSNKDSFIPLDLLYGRSLSEARALAQRLVSKFGQLVYWWPEMMKVSRSLRSQGYRLANPI
jgi:hypothetical protein